MSEEVLKVDLRELATIRLRLRDETVIELPVAKLSEYAVRHEHEFERATARNLKELGQVLKDLVAANAELGIEFVVRPPA